VSTIFNIDKNISGVNGYGLPFCNAVFTATIAATTDTTLAVPLTNAIGLANATNATKFIAQFSFQSGKDVFVANNATAAVPAGSTFAASTSELNPLAKFCKAGDVLHFYCSSTADISVAFYVIQST